MKRQVNVHFLRKMASDELIETAFFCTGHKVAKTRTPAHTELVAGPIVIKIKSTRSININGDHCVSVPEAKYVIAQFCGLNPA